MAADLNVGFWDQHPWHTDKCDYQYYQLYGVLGRVTPLPPHIRIPIRNNRLY